MTNRKGWVALTCKVPSPTRTECWVSARRWCCTAASPTPAAAEATAAAARTALASPGDAPAGRRAPGWRPHRPAPRTPREREPPGPPTTTKLPRGVFVPPHCSPCLFLPPTLLCCFGYHGVCGQGERRKALKVWNDGVSGLSFQSKMLTSNPGRLRNVVDGLGPLDVFYLLLSSSSFVFFFVCLFESVWLCDYYSGEFNKKEKKKKEKIKKPPKKNYLV